MSRPTFSDSTGAHVPQPARTHALAEPRHHPAHSAPVGTDSVRTDSPDDIEQQLAAVLAAGYADIEALAIEYDEAEAESVAAALEAFAAATDDIEQQLAAALAAGYADIEHQDVTITTENGNPA